MIKYNYWEIRVDGIWEDTVSYQNDMSEEEVKKSLIDHDGYPSNIELTLVGGN
jgi:hypothetical protein